jgi:8-oxo-dGTP pyrophosphatase MutT (NUDIX family)
VNKERGGGGLNYERSCGAVIYRKHHGNTEVLLIQHTHSGYWSFPKGHQNEGETDAQTALREIKEETGLDVYIDESFCEAVQFSPRRGTMKTVIYFIASLKSREVIPQYEEITDYRWVEVTQAINLLTYENDKTIITRAKNFIQFHV